MALSFDGSTQFGVTSATVNLSSAQAIAVSLWVNAANATAAIPLEHSSIGPNNAGGWGFWYGINFGTELEWQVNLTSGGSTDCAGNTIGTGTWHNFIANMDPHNNRVQVYQDNVLKATYTLTGTPVAFLSSTLNFGARGNGSGFKFAGDLAHIAIWQNAASGLLLSAADVSAVWNGGVADWTKVVTVSPGAPAYGWTLHDASGAAAYGGVPITWTGSPGVVAFGNDGSSPIHSRRGLHARVGCRGPRFLIPRGL